MSQKGLDESSPLNTTFAFQSPSDKPNVALVLHQTYDVSFHTLRVLDRLMFKGGLEKFQTSSYFLGNQKRYGSKLNQPLMILFGRISREEICCLQNSFSFNNHILQVPKSRMIAAND